MTKKDILRNFLQDPSIVFSHTPIKKLGDALDGYTTCITFLPGCRIVQADPEDESTRVIGPGLRLVIYLPMDAHWCLTALFNSSNQVVDWYFDINRRHYMNENGIPCFDDLYLDLVVLPTGQVITVDADELEEALGAGKISIEDYRHAYQVHDQLKDSQWCDVDFLRQFVAGLYP